MPRAQKHILGPTRNILVSLLVQLRDNAPDDDTRRRRQFALDCARWANAQYRKHGYRGGLW